MLINCHRFDMASLKNDKDSSLPKNEDEASMRTAVARVQGVIEAELGRGVPSTRIFLGGFSQGCAISLLTLLSSPHQLGGLVCLSGWLPLTERSYTSLNGTMHIVSPAYEHLAPWTGSLISCTLS